MIVLKKRFITTEATDTRKNPMCAIDQTDEIRIRFFLVVSNVRISGLYAALIGFRGQRFEKAEDR
jgi:hypothetical protein